MPITDAARILLVADASQADGENTKAKFRRYRLARLQVDASRRDRPGPRYEYLKRTHD
jgi:hypothetical protein